MIYHKQTAPLVKFYQDWQEQNRHMAPKYIEINGDGDVLAIHNQLIKLLTNKI